MKKPIMKVAAVVIDDWKLPVFKRRLDAAGFKYDDPIPFTTGCLTLRVHYEWVHELQPIIEAGQKECEILSCIRADGIVP